MANTRTITSANSVLMLAVAGIFPVAQKIEGFAADNMFDTDAFNSSEVVMGVDGRMSAGWVPVVKTQTYTLQADSESIDLFDQWSEIQNTAREVFFADATILLPSVGKKYALTRGVLSNFTPMPGLGKTLKPMTFQITWQDISRSRI